MQKTWFWKVFLCTKRKKEIGISCKKKKKANPLLLWEPLKNVLLVFF